MEAAAGQATRVLVATQAEEVCEILETRHDAVYDVVLFPEEIGKLLPQVEVVVIDYDDIGGSNEDKARLQEEIYVARKWADEYSSEEFLMDPDRCLGGTGRFGVNIRRLPKKCCLAFVSYSGGTGRTTLAMDTAFCYADTLQKYAQKNKRPSVEGSKPGWPMLVEMIFGISSLVSVTGLEAPRLMQLATDPEVLPERYRGVDLVPMDYENVRVLAVDLLERYFKREIDRHPLTVIDAIWPHSLSDALADHVDLWLVVASDRPDTIANATKLYAELVAKYGDTKVWLLQNGVSDQTGGKESDAVSWDVHVPEVARPDEYRGELGSAVLSRVFSPVWEEYAKPRKSGRSG